MRLATWLSVIFGAIAIIVTVAQPKIHCALWFVDCPPQQPEGYQLNPPPAPPEVKTGNLIGTWYYTGSERGIPVEICFHLNEDGSLKVQTNFNGDFDDYPLGRWSYSTSSNELLMNTPGRAFATSYIRWIDDNHLEATLVNASNGPSSVSTPIKRDYYRTPCIGRIAN